MKPFNLEEAKAGKPVCTRDGRSVRIVSFDVNSSTGESIAALVPRKSDGDDMFLSYFATGLHYTNREDVVDLFMASTTKTVWVNLYSGGKLSPFPSDIAYASEEIAKRAVCETWPYLGTFPITYEE